MRTKRLVSIGEALRGDTAVVRAGRGYGGDLGFGTLWRWVWNWILRRAEVRRQRRDLADLTAQELQDVGVTPEQAWRESRKPFWRD